MVVAYGKILPKALEYPSSRMFTLPPPPRHRGASRFIRLDLQGDETTGVALCRWTKGSTCGSRASRATIDTNFRTPELESRLALERNLELRTSMTSRRQDTRSLNRQKALRMRLLSPRPMHHRTDPIFRSIERSELTTLGPERLCFLGQREDFSS